MCICLPRRNGCQNFPVTNVYLFRDRLKFVESFVYSEVNTKMNEKNLKPIFSPALLHSFPPVDSCSSLILVCCCFSLSNIRSSLQANIHGEKKGIQPLPTRSSLEVIAPF